jgi:tRNA modification GTPase
VLRGWPNVGKSSLFNALAGRGKAIVATEAGTTRDYLEADIECESLTCRLIDTAGVDQRVEHAIEEAAQHAAKQQSESADVELLCLDATRPLNRWEQNAVRECRSHTRLIVRTKVDLPGGGRGSADRDFPAIETSSRTGQGLVELRRRVFEVLSDGSGPGSVVAATAQRSRDAVHRAQIALRAAIDAAAEPHGEELIAVEIREALDRLGTVAGAVYTDELLDGIFSRFCIGK